MASPLDRAVVATLPLVPERVVARFAEPYVAGPSLAHGLDVVRRLHAAGRTATFDVLGEELHSAAEVSELVDVYLEILRHPTPVEPAPTLSVRMTALGLRIDPALPWQHLATLAAEAQSRSRALTIDMEDVTTLEPTLDHYRRLRAEGFDNVGIVLQAYLRRTPRDVEALLPLVPRVRVVKGIWVEHPDVAYGDFDIIRGNYVRLLGALLAGGCYVEIATHDEWLVAEALELLRRHGRRPDSYEFQMLLGVRPELGDVLVRDGHPVRVYVPFGRDWRGYCLRRLRESPDVARHVIADTVQRLKRSLRRAA